MEKLDDQENQSAGLDMGRRLASQDHRLLQQPTLDSCLVGRLAAIEMASPIASARAQHRGLFALLKHLEIGRDQKPSRECRGAGHQRPGQFVDHDRLAQTQPLVGRNPVPRRQAVQWLGRLSMSSKSGFGTACRFRRVAAVAPAPERNLG